MKEYNRFIRQFHFFVSLNDERYKHPKITCVDQGKIKLQKQLNIKMSCQDKAKLLQTHASTKDSLG